MAVYNCNSTEAWVFEEDMYLNGVSRVWKPGDDQEAVTSMRNSIAGDSETDG